MGVAQNHIQCLLIMLLRSHVDQICAAAATATDVFRAAAVWYYSSARYLDIAPHVERNLNFLLPYVASSVSTTLPWPLRRRRLLTANVPGSGVVIYGRCALLHVAHFAIKWAHRFQGEVSPEPSRAGGMGFFKMRKSKMENASCCTTTCAVRGRTEKFSPSKCCFSFN